MYQHEVMRLQFLAISCALFATLLLHLTIMPPVPAANELENATMKAWISDTHGISEEPGIEDANVHVPAEGAKFVDQTSQENHYPLATNQ